MTFSKTLRGITVGAIAAALTLTSVSAQNGTNYHILTNTGDTIYGGVGAGGGQTTNDGVGTFLAGEDMRGSHMTSLGDWGYRMTRFRENFCVLGAGFPGYGLKSSGVMMVEMDGGTGATGLGGNGFGPSNPVVFTNPTCIPGPTTYSAGFVPYGTGPASTASFLVTLLPSGLGLPSGQVAILPDNGIIGSVGGTATIVVFGSFNLPVNSTGYCWALQFNFGGTSVPFLDDIDGMWHYIWNSPDNNQYWLFSTDEMNIWQSQTVATDGGTTALFQFLAQTDYNLLLATVEPQTTLSNPPWGADPFAGATGTGTYYAQTSGFVTETGAAALNLNAGIDIGRGSNMKSFAGASGALNPFTGNSNQSPLNNPAAAFGTFGFTTFDNGGDGNGSVRLTWCQINTDTAFGTPPNTHVDLTKFGGTIRIPVYQVDSLTSLCFGLFGHKTADTSWDDPDGLGAGAFNITSIVGASSQLPTGPQPAACSGLAISIRYGSSGRKDGPGGLTWDPSVADTSGSKLIFLFD